MSMFKKIHPVLQRCIQYIAIYIGNKKTKTIKYIFYKRSYLSILLIFVFERYVYVKHRVAVHEGYRVQNNNKNWEKVQNKIKSHVHTQEARTFHLPFNKIQLFELFQQTLYLQYIYILQNHTQVKIRNSFKQKKYKNRCQIRLGVCALVLKITLREQMQKKYFLVLTMSVLVILLGIIYFAQISRNSLSASTCLKHSIYPCHCNPHENEQYS